MRYLKKSLSLVQAVLPPLCPNGQKVSEKYLDSHFRHRRLKSIGSIRSCLSALERSTLYKRVPGPNLIKVFIMLSIVGYCSLYTVFKYTLLVVKVFTEAPNGQLKSIIILLLSLFVFFSTHEQRYMCTTTVQRIHIGTKNGFVLHFSIQIHFNMTGEFIS